MLKRFDTVRLRQCAFGLMVLMTLAACSDSNGSATVVEENERPEAVMVVGQADFTGLLSNRGGAIDALGLGQPQGSIATDGSKFFVADYGNNRILGWNTVPSEFNTPPDFVLGQQDFNSNATTRFALPAHVAIADGRLLVTDAGKNRVLIWNTLPSADVPPDVVVGQTDLSGEEPGLAADKLSFPVWASAASGRLVVSDQQNHRVLIWNSLPSSNGVAADVVLGQADFASNEAGDEDVGLTNPAGVWTDGFRLLVADSGNHRVLYWSQLPRESTKPATYVVGQSDFSRISPGVNQSQFRTPFGLSSDGTRFYVADAGNNRVLEFDSFPIANGSLATDVYGQDSYNTLQKNDDDLDGFSEEIASERVLNSPTGVLLFDGVLYVTDRNNHRVLFFPG